jgi:DNA (cytosine-5)-methyltransferase 1
MSPFHPLTLAIRGRGGEPDIEWRQDGTANAILTPNGGRAGMGVGAIAFAQNTRDEIRLFGGDGQTVGALAAEPGMRQQSYVAAPTVAKTLTKGAESSGKGGYARRRQEDDDNLVTHAIQAGATRENPSSGPDGVGVQEGVAYTLESRQEVQAVQSAWAVRRLTPRECERLQGFPDDFTNIPWNGKPTAADGPRYKALGNSMAVNVMRWIGQRIDLMEKLIAEGKV